LLAGLFSIVAVGSLSASAAAGSDIPFQPSVGSCDTSGGAAPDQFRLVVRDAVGAEKYDADVCTTRAGDGVIRIDTVPSLAP